MSLSDSGNKKVARFFEPLAQIATRVLFFLVPLFFLPWTSNVIELNKQALFIVLTILGLVAWLGQMVTSKELKFKSGWFQVVPGVFLLSVLCSSIFSVAGYQTWVGQSSQEYTSFLSIALFVVLFYFLANTSGDIKQQTHILGAFLLSSAISSVLALLSMFGLVHLPFDFAASNGFNTIGNVNQFISFMSVAMFTGLSMWLVSESGRDRVIPLGGTGMFLRALIVIVTVVNMIAMIAIDYWVFWVLNIVGVLLLAAFGFLQGSEFPNPKRFALPLVILLVSVLLLFLPSPLKLKIPLVASPSFSASFQIAKTTLGASTKNLFFGSGPGTFVHDFLAYKPVGVNASRLWSLHFDRAKSALLTNLATLGILGTLTWLAFALWLLVKSLGKLVREKNEEDWKMTYVLFVGYVMILLTHVLNPSNFALSFLFWGMSGLLGAQVLRKQWKSNFSESPRLGLASSFAFVLVGVGVVASLFITGQRYVADAAFAKAVKLDASGAPVEKVIETLAVAVKYNPYSDIYYRNLASGLLSQARKMTADLGGKEPTAEQTQAISTKVQAAVNAAARATEIEPNNVDNWAVRGAIYRDLMSYAKGAEQMAEQTIKNTIRLEALNPAHRTNLGRVYLAVADRARSLKNAENPELAKTAVEQEKTLLTSSEQAFVSAIKIKADYLPAHYYLAAVYERQGKLPEAAARLKAISQNAPSDIGVGFQLSQLFIRLQKFDLAKAELERIVKINNKYSNGLWYLASMYELEKNPAKAVELVQKVVQLNPENKAAKERLENLKAGKVTTVLPEPIQADQGSTVKDDSDKSAEKEEASEEEKTSNESDS